jgi:Cu+-exporting ATPase
MKKEKYLITGMSCSACSSRVEKVTAKLAGMQKASVNLLTNSMQVEYDEQKLSAEQICQAVADAGYGASLAPDPLGGTTTAAAPAANTAVAMAAAEITALHKRLVFSLLFLIPLLYVAMHTMLARFGLPVPAWLQSWLDGPANAVIFAFTQFLLVLPILFLNQHFYQAGLKNLAHGAPNMDTLVAVGSGSAFLYGIFAIYRIGWGLGHGDLALVQTYSTNLYFESAGMIVTLITLGRFLESRAKGKTSAAITKLMNLVPKQATVLRAGQELTLPAAELVQGDLVLVRPGENFSADGTILEGTTSVDEAALTGESIPVDKQPGDAVIAATINKTGFVKFTATRVGADSTISQIIKLVDAASSSKAPIARLADKIAGIFVPAVMLIALAATLGWLALGATFEFAFSIGIAVLVISCPCALGLATPVAIMVGTGWGAQHGILVKSGEALEAAHAIDTVVLDKTGTITTGKPQVTEVLPLNGSTRDLLQLAATLEHGSEHPLGTAIVSYAAGQKIQPGSAANFQARFGKGLSADLKGQTYYAGSSILFKELGLDLAPVQGSLDELADRGRTPLLFGSKTQVLGIIALADTPKPTSLTALAALKKMGLSLVLLTGDNERTARAIAGQLGLDQVRAQVLPAEKAQVISELQAQGHKVAMIGDGINDAPALAQADLGIAIGAGTDIAIDSADAVLMRSDLVDAVKALQLSKAVLRNIKENLFWAFFYNIICIPVAAGLLYPAFGLKLSPMLGAAAMSMSSVCVVTNALRLRYFKADLGSRKEAGPLPAPAAVQEAVMPTAVVLPPVAATVFTHNQADAVLLADDQPQKAEVLTMEKTLKVEGMMCMHCQKHVTEALQALPGVTAVDVNLDTKLAKVTATRDIPQAEFKQAITAAGYELVSA